MSVNLLDQDCFHLTIRFNTKMEFTMFYKFLEHLSKMRWCAFQKKKKQKMLVGFFFFFLGFRRYALHCRNRFRKEAQISSRSDQREEAVCN